MSTNAIRLCAVVAAVILLGLEDRYESNRQAHGVVTSGRTIDKVEIDACYLPPITDEDPAFARDYNQAVAETCGPWLWAHYVKIVSISLASIGLLLFVPTFSGSRGRAEKRSSYLDRETILAIAALLLVALVFSIRQPS